MYMCRQLSYGMQTENTDFGRNAADGVRSLNVSKHSYEFTACSSFVVLAEQQRQDCD